MNESCDNSKQREASLNETVINLNDVVDCRLETHKIRSKNYEYY